MKTPHQALTILNSILTDENLVNNQPQNGWFVILRLKRFEVFTAEPQSTLSLLFCFPLRGRKTKT